MSIENVNDGQIVGKLTSKEHRISGEVQSSGAHLAGTVSTAGATSVPFDYNKLRNKPMIEGVVLEGNKTFEELNLNILTNEELEAILK